MREKIAAMVLGDDDGCPISFSLCTRGDGFNTPSDVPTCAECKADTILAVVLKAVAEWYADDCSVESHPGRPQGRVGCMNCKVMLLSALHAGKMPGEEA